MSRCPRMTTIVVMMATCLFVSSSAMAQWRKLVPSSPATADIQPPPAVPGLSTGLFPEQEPPFRISPDGSRVVFIQDRTTDDVPELWSIPFSGGSPVRLNALLTSGTAVYRYEVSPDSSRVVYIAPQDTATKPELYSVPIDGPFTAADRLNPALPGGVGVGNFEISPDGSRVVFTTLGAPVSDPSWPRLYSVPLTGGSATILAQGPAPPLTVRTPVLVKPSFEFQITPDGTKVVFVHDPDGAGAAVAELYRVPIAGGSAVRVNDPLPATGAVRSFGLSPDSTRAWYIADARDDDVYELFSVPLVGGGTVRINGALVSGGDVQDARFTPDSSRIVYVADQVTDNVSEIFSSPATVRAAIKISGLLPADTAVIELHAFWSLTSSGDYVVYRLYDRVNDTINLFSAPVNGSADPRRLHPPLLVDGGSSIFRASPVDDRVAVSAQTRAADPLVLYVTDAAGGPIWRVSPLLQPSGDVFDFRFDPAGSMLVVALRINDTDSTDLYFLPAVWDPTSLPTVRPPFAGGTAGGLPTWSPDAGEVLFTGDVETDDVIELFGTPAVLFASGFEAGHTWSWSSRTNVPAAVHDVCATGDILDPAADECVAALCSSDLYCCGLAGGGFAYWDAQCVSEVAWACDRTCP